MNPLDETKTVYQDTVLGTAKVCFEVLKGGTQVARETNIRKIAEMGDGGVDGPTENDSFAHIRDLYERSLCNLSSEEAEIFKTLLCSYSDVFKDEWDLGQTHLAEHKIITGEQRPIKQPPRRVPLALAEEEKNAIQQLQDKGLIRPSVSPWSSPLVLVRKKNGKNTGVCGLQTTEPDHHKRCLPITTHSGLFEFSCWFKIFFNS